MVVYLYDKILFQKLWEPRNIWKLHDQFYSQLFFIAKFLFYTIFKNFINLNAYSLQIFKISSAITKEEKAENGEGYLTSWCAGGRGNTTHTPEAMGVKLQSPDSLGKIWDIQ